MIRHFKKIVLSHLGLLLTIGCPLCAEIERVTVTWNPQICLDGCVNDITRQLQRVAGVAEIIISQPQGQADVRWKPKVPFSYDFIRNAVAGVGANILNVRAQVRGTLIVTPNAVILESLGDNTRFVLMSPAQQSFYKNVPQRNFDVHALAPEMRDRLAAAAAQSVVVTVKGPLFHPSYGLYLIIEQIAFNKLGP